MAGSFPFDERAILRAIAEGSEAAFVQLFDKYSAKVYNVAYKFLDSREQAEEIVQDVFMDVWISKDKMAEVLNLNAYILGMVRKKVYDAYRQKSSFAQLIKELSDNPPTENAVERNMQEREYEILLQRALAKLPHHQQEIFGLAREEGLSHEEIAKKLNLSRLSVKAHMKRILRVLRQTLGPVLKAETTYLILLFKIGRAHV